MADAVEIKGEMMLLNVLHVVSGDLAAIREGLKQKRDSLPQLFLNSPLLVDCQALGDTCDQLDMQGLRQAVLELGFVPVGIRHLPETCTESALQAGWSLMRPGRSMEPRTSRATEEIPQAHPATAAQQPPVRRVEVIGRPVRSGQQIYFPDSDIVVLQHTSAGSELLAGGSVHVYGSLRGRVLAGIHGDTSARIFCQKLEAELVAIAGHYRLMDDIDTGLKGQPAMVWLEGEKLKVAPMF